MKLDEAFKQITIRARVAFAIVCLERALKAKHLESAEWKIVLERLWYYTEVKFLDDWDDVVLEFLPRFIMVCNSYKADSEYVGEELFYRLKRTYENADVFILDIADTIYHVGTICMFGSIEDGGMKSVSELMEIVEIMNKNNVKTPDVCYFSKFKFTQENDWGESFTKIDIDPAAWS